MIRQGAMLIACVIWVVMVMASGCDNEDRDVEGRTVVRQLDKSDAGRVYDWALAACRDAPMLALAKRFETKANPDSILDKIGSAFPPETAKAATDGCRAGFKARRKKSDS